MCFICSFPIRPPSLLLCRVFRLERGSGPAVDRESQNPCDRILHLSVHVRCHHVSPDSRMPLKPRLMFLAVPLLPWVRSRNAVNWDPSSSSSLYGRHSSTIPLPAGPGTPTDGRSSWAVSILLVGLRCIFLPELPHLQSLSSSESDADTELTVSRTSPTTPHMSSWAQFSFGSDGSDSTVVPLFLRISGLHRLVS